MNFHIDSKFAAVGDVLRSYAWEVDIPKLDQVTSSLDSEGFKIRARSASIPGRSIQPIESNYRGMKQMFAGRVTFNHTWPVTLEEFQDQKVQMAMYEWNQLIFDVDPNKDTGGGSQGITDKRGDKGYAVNIILTQLKYDNSPLAKRIELVNAWPQSVDDVGLDYGGNDSVKLNVTFAYDFWKYI